METGGKRLVEYETLSGKNPFRDWLDCLDYVVRARIEARLKRISYGSFGDVKFVGKGVYEIRLFFGSGYRIYFAQYEEQIVVLLCAGDKASQENDITKARDYWLDFQRRNNASCKQRS